MTQKTINIFAGEIFSKPPKKNCSTNKISVYYIDDIWSLDIFDIKDYGLETNGNYRYVLVVICKLSNYGLTVPLKNKNAQTIKDSFENKIITSKKPNFFESDRGKEFYSNNFQNFSNNYNIKHYFRYTF